MSRTPRGDLPVEWIDNGEPPAGWVPGPRPRPPGWRWWWALIPGAALLAVIAVALPGGPGHRRGAGTTTTVLAPELTLAAPALVKPAQVTDVGHPLLVAPPTWELIGRGADLVRIQLNAGRITRTALPLLQSSGPVYLVAGADRVLVRPLDFVPGYVVPDGQPAERLTGLLGVSGPAFPGPDSHHLWIGADHGNQRQMDLVSFDGTPTGASVPSTDTFPDAPDGRGGLLFTAPDGVYLERPGSRVRVTTRHLLAVSASQWLIAECIDRPGCALTVINRATGATQRLTQYRSANIFGGPLGVISPDGTTAAVAEYPSRGPLLHLLDLTSGRDLLPPEPLGATVGAEPVVVWTPDSRALFFVDAAGGLHLLDVTTRVVRDLGVALPPLHQLAFRS